MNDPRAATTAERPRISIIQRLLPSFAFSAVALCGGVASLFIIQVLNSITTGQSGGGQGIGAIATALSYASTSISAGTIIGGLLIFPVIVTFIAMLFPARKTAIPPGPYTFVLAVLSLIPMMLCWPIWRKLVLAPLFQEDIRPQIPFYYVLQYGAVVISIVTVFAGLAFSFVPLRAKPGKKFGAIVVMVLFLFVLIAAKAFLSYQIYQLGNIGRY